MRIQRPSEITGHIFRRLTEDETKDIIENGKLLNEIEPPPSHLFSDDELTKMKKGEPIFVWYDYKVAMVTCQDTIKAYEVEEPTPDPPLSIYKKAKRFIISLFNI